MTRRILGKLFGINFAISVTTGLTMEFGSGQTGPCLLALRR